MRLSAKAVQASFWPEEEIVGMSPTAETYLGAKGRKFFVNRGVKMSTTIFNASLFNARAEKIWFGDLDIQRDEDALLRLSAKIGNLYILDKLGERFLGQKPSLYSIRNKAAVIIEEGRILCSKFFAVKAGIVKGKVNL